jgi:hypothetical protein
METDPYIDEGEDATLDKILAMLAELENKKAPGGFPGGP